MVIGGLNGISVETESYRIMNTRTNAEDERVLFVLYRDAYGSSHSAPLLLKQIEGKWKIGRLAEQTLSQ